MGLISLKTKLTQEQIQKMAGTPLPESVISSFGNNRVIDDDEGYVNLFICKKCNRVWSHDYERPYGVDYYYDFPKRQTEKTCKKCRKAK